jgi:hypothetical protein
MSIRQAILMQLLARVTAIQVANGFSTDAGLAVLFGETPMLGPDDPSAAIAVIVGDDQSPDPYANLGDDVLTQVPVDIQAIARADVDQPWQTVEAIIADIKRAVETGDRTLGGLLTRNLQRGRTRTLNREPGATSIGASVQYAPIYLETWGG